MSSPAPTSSITVTHPYHHAYGKLAIPPLTRMGKDLKGVYLVDEVDVSLWAVPFETNPTLASLHLAYHPVICAFACTACDIILPPPREAEVKKRIVLHLTQPPHQLRRVNVETALEAVWESCNPLGFHLFPVPAKATAGRLSAIQHASVKAGYLCAKPGCNWCAITPGKGKPLPHTCLQGGTGQANDTLPCFVQTIDFGNGIGSYTFPVLEPPIPEVEVDSFAHRRLVANQHIPLPMERLHPDLHRRDLQPILRQYNWDQLVEGLSPEALAMASAYDVDIGDDAGWAGLTKMLGAFFDGINARLPGGDGIGERIVAAGRRKGEEIKGEMLRKVGTATVREYVSTFSTILLYGLRWLMNPTLVSRVFMTDELLEAYSQLNTAVINNDQRNLQLVLITVVCAILRFYPRGPRIGMWDALLPRWYMLHCRRKDGSFRDPHGCTKPIAGVLWCMRTTIFAHLSSVVEDPSQDDPGRERAIEEHVQLVASSEITICGAFLRVKAYISTLNANQVNLPLCYWRDPPHTKVHNLMTVNSQHTSITEVRNAVHRLIAQCESKTEKLLEPLDLSADKSLDNIHDRLGSTTLGYSAATDERNHLGSSAANALWDHLCDWPEWAVTIVGGDKRLGFHNGVRPDHSDLAWNHARVRELMAYIDDVNARLGTLIHLVYGSPARGTELLTLKMVNCVEGPRSWYVLGSRVVIVCRWQKTSELSGNTDHLIPRVLDAKVSQLFLQNMAYIRPLQVRLASVLHWDQQQIDNTRCFFYTQLGRRVDTSWLTAQLKTTGMAQSTSVQGGIGVEEWRQLVAYVQDYFGIRVKLDDTPADGSVLAFGHSSAVHASWYNRDGDWMPGVEVHLMKRSMDVGNFWHGVLGLSNAVPRTAEGETVVGGMEGVDGEGAPSRRQDGVAHAQLERLTGAIAALQEEVQHLRDQGSHPPATHQSKSRLLPLGNIEVNAARIHQLNTLGIPSFRSCEQARIAEKIIKGDADGLYILPTGAGKTLPYFLAASVIGEHKYIAVCVPFRALLANLLTRADAMGLDVWEWVPLGGSWRGEDRAPTGLCLVSVERMSDFGAWAHGHTDRLHAIIIEEAHELVHSADYRLKMQSISRLRSLGVPWYLCSASLPLHMEQQLLDQCGISQAWQVRVPTSRQELGYHVWPTDVDARTGVTTVVHVIKSWLSAAIFGNIGKIIIFCQLRDEVDAVVDALGGTNSGILGYHSRMGEPDRRASLEAFGNNTMARVIVATSGLGAGVDWDMVMGVVFLGLPDSLLGLDQGFGRAGRGAYNAICLAIPKATNPFKEDELVGEKRASWEDVKLWRRSEKCRRWWITKMVSGEGFTCAMEGREAMWCDHCWEQSGRGRPTCIPWDMAGVRWNITRWTDRDQAGVPIFLVKGSKIQPDRKGKGKQVDTIPVTPHQRPSSPMLIGDSPVITDPLSTQLGATTASTVQQPAPEKQSAPAMTRMPATVSAIPTPRAPQISSDLPTSRLPQWSRESQKTEEQKAAGRQARAEAIRVASNQSLGSKRPAEDQPLGRAVRQASGSRLTPVTPAAPPRAQLLLAPPLASDPGLSPPSPSPTPSGGYVRRPMWPRPESPLRMDQDKAYTANANFNSVVHELWMVTQNLYEPQCAICWASAGLKVKHFRNRCTAGGCATTPSGYWSDKTAKYDHEHEANDLGNYFDDPLKNGQLCWYCWMPNFKDMWHDTTRPPRDQCKMGRVGRRVLWVAWGMEGSGPYPHIQKEFNKDANQLIDYINSVDVDGVPSIWRLLTWLLSPIPKSEYRSILMRD